MKYASVVHHRNETNSLHLQGLRANFYVVLMRRDKFSQRIFFFPFYLTAFPLNVAVNFQFAAPFECSFELISRMLTLRLNY